MRQVGNAKWSQTPRTNHPTDFYLFRKEKNSHNCVLFVPRPYRKKTSSQLVICVPSGLPTRFHLQETFLPSASPEIRGCPAPSSARVSRWSRATASPRTTWSPCGAPRAGLGASENRRSGADKSEKSDGELGLPAPGALLSASFLGGGFNPKIERSWCQLLLAILSILEDRVEAPNPGFYWESTNKKESKKAGSGEWCDLFLWGEKSFRFLPSWSGTHCQGRLGNGWWQWHCFLLALRESRFV